MKIILIQPHRRTGRFTITAITFLVLLVWPQARLQSAIVTWDAVTGTTGAQDGSGTWNTVTANWWNGSTDVLWPNSTNDTAVVGAASGSAGTINISGTITLSNLTFNAAGSGNYTLAGGTLSFSGPAQPTIIVNTDATISSSILGTNLNKSGAGDLTLNGNNAALAGNLIVSSGVLNIASSTALGSISAVDTSGVNGASTVFSGDISIPSGTLMNRAHVSAYAYTNLSGNNTWGGGRDDQYFGFRQSLWHHFHGGKTDANWRGN